MAYVQVEQSLLMHRKTFVLAELAGMDEYAVVGRRVARGMVVS
jgi:hypothetical protein